MKNVQSHKPALRAAELSYTRKRVDLEKERSEPASRAAELSYTRKRVETRKNKYRARFAGDNARAITRDASRNKQDIYRPRGGLGSLSDRIYTLTHVA
jgi:hypothetical protein